MNLQHQSVDPIEQRLRTAAQVAVPYAQPPSLVQLRDIQRRRLRRRLVLQGSIAAAACVALLLGVWVDAAGRAVQQDPPRAFLQQAERSPVLPPVVHEPVQPQRVSSATVNSARPAVPPVFYRVYQTQMVMLPVTDDATEMATGSVRFELRPVMHAIDPRHLTNAQRLMVERLLRPLSDDCGPSL